MASASLPRVLSRRLLTAPLARPLAPTTTFKLPVAALSWSGLGRQLSTTSVASLQSWKLARNSRENALCRALDNWVRFSSGVSYTVPQLEEQVLSVLKMFDKVKPEKVSIL